MHEPTLGITSDSSGEESSTARQFPSSREETRDRFLVVVELEAVRRRLREQQRRLVTLQRVFTSVAAVLMGVVLSVGLSAFFGNGIAPTDQLVAYISATLALLAAALPPLYALLTRRMQDALYETAASKFQHELIKSWENVDRAERDLAELIRARDPERTPSHEQGGGDVRNL